MSDTVQTDGARCGILADQEGDPMTLEKARRVLERKFKRVLPAKDSDGDPQLPVIVSGGEMKIHDIFPVLYSKEEDAIKAWVRQMEEVRGEVLEWVMEPEVECFLMTMADRLGRQRMVTSRYAVKCQMRVK